MTEQQQQTFVSGTIIEENISFDEFVTRYEGKPVEWHAGKVVYKVSNNKRHQEILGFLVALLNLFLGFKQPGKLYIDGYPMYISDEQPARQPDIMIVLPEHYDRLEDQRLNGTADLVIEIVSPATAAIDRGEKFAEYETAGVPEYWIIDPIRQSFDQYGLDERGYYQRLSGSPDRLVSRVLQGFELDAAVLWREDLPAGAELLELLQGREDSNS